MFYICCDDNKNNTTINSDADLENTWILDNIFKKSNSEILSVPSDFKKMYLVFTDSSFVWIFSSCNSGKGYFKTFESDSLVIDSIELTLLYCLSDTIREWEDLFIKSLSGSYKYSISNKKMVIETSGNYNLIFNLKGNSRFRKEENMKK